MIKLVLLLVPLVFLLMTAVNFMNAGDGRLSRGDRLKTIVIGILVAVLVAGISFGLSMGTSYLTSFDSASAGIALNYPEASSGLNPDSSRFNPSSIISEEVLREVISRGGFSDVTVEDLKQSLSVSNAMDGVTYTTEDDYKIVSQYTVTFQKQKGMKSMDPYAVVNTVVEVFREKFSQKYSDNYSVLTIDADQFADIDYLDASLLMDKEAERLRQYMLSYASRYWGFVSSNGDSFDSVSQKISNFRDVQLEKLDSYILTNGLSRNADQYISRLEYDNSLLNVYYQKNVSSYNIRLDAIDKYDEELARVVLVPTEDQNGEFYMSQTQIGVDYFADQADQYLAEYAKIQRDSDENSYRITCFQDAKGGDQGYQTVEDMLTSLLDELNSLAEQASSIAQEFSRKKASTYVTLIRNEARLVDRLNLKQAAIYAAICAAFVALWAYSLGRSYAGKQARKGANRYE